MACLTAPPRPVRVLALALLGGAGALGLLEGMTGYAQQKVHVPMLGKTISMPPEEAARAAAADRAKTNAQTAPGLELSVWAPQSLVADPLAIDMDASGVAFVVASPRSGQLLDIREHTEWIPLIHTFNTTEDLRQFFKKEMAPERSAQNTWLPDSNGDGSHDWRDLTVVKERVYRVEDTNQDGVADRSRVVFEGFNEDVASDIAGGILVHGKDLFVTAAPDLWRLRDTDNDGVFDAAESISHGYSIHPAFSGHDLSALVHGPDGRIYWKIGDIGMNVVDKTGKRWAYPNQGAVLRADPDGSNFEVFATGLRNTQEIAFDDHGNLVSVDNDGDHPGEMERVVYITQGSDAGWRSTWQFGKYTDPSNNRYNVWMNEGLSRPRFDGQAAYIVPPVASHKPGPSGFAWNPGTALDERWRKHFFVTSFTGDASSARVFAFQLTPEGAGFALGEDVEILRGVLSPGMRIGPDGAMYLTDWMRGWGSSGEGRIWKLDSTAGAKDPMRAEVKGLLNENFQSRDEAALRTLLGHIDQRVRLKAQFELVRRGSPAPLASTAQQDKQQLARLHAIWGIGQLIRSKSAPTSLLLPLLRDQDAEVRAQAAKTLGDVRATDAVAALTPLLSDAEPRPRFFAAEALGRIGDRAAIAPIVAMLAENDNRDVYLRHAGSTALARLNDPAALVALSSHASPGARLAAVVALRRLRDPGVAKFLGDSDELVVTEAARAINDETGITAALPALAASLTETKFTNEALLRRAISANARLGTPESAARLSAFAARPTTATPLREEAIRALVVWMSPSRFDRVDGAELGTEQATGRDAGAARAALTKLVPMLAQADTAPEVKLALIEGAGRLEMKEVAPTLLTLMRNDTSAPIRVASLNALQALAAPELAEAVTIALDGKDAQLRMAAISAIPAIPGDEGQKAAQLDAVIKSGAIGEQQAAVGALGRLKGPAAQASLDALLGRVESRSVPPELQLDVLDAARASESPALAKKLEQMRVGRDLANLASVFPQALQQGGSAQRGRTVAMNDPAAQCVRCHTVGNAAATVGPDLRRVGSQLTREQLV